MKTDSELRLAMAMHSSPGVYALLLGSGISRAAGVPTGWEVVLDLIGEVTRAVGEPPPVDPEEWFRERYGDQPDYARLLGMLAKTSAERGALLRRYFEPTDEEREGGLKRPTAGHRAIAQLVKHGYVRVIITTNFDRLIEQALEAEGIEPVVIASSDALKGAPPLQHASCTVVKLHGDYRDTRIKNTPDELAKYSPALNKFLDRVFDEHGLAVCGWSGEWDTALRAAIIRCASRRYSTFWLSRHEPSDEAARVIAQRSADVVTIESAETFLPQLAETLESLRDLAAPLPMSTAIAVATTKRYIPDGRHRVRLNELVRDETERVYAAVAALPWNDLSRERTRESFQLFMKRIEAATDRLCEVVAALAYYGDPDAAYLLTGCVERLVQTPPMWISHRETLLLYPSVLVVYAAGMMSLESRRYQNLAATLRAPVYRDTDGRQKPAIKITHLYEAFYGNTDRWVPREKAGSEFTPANNHLHDHLRPVLRDYLPDDAKYSDIFDLFEYLLGLAYFDLIEREYMPWSPPGRFMWRWRDEPSSSLGEVFVTNGKTEGGDWALLKAGFFNGSPARLEEIVVKMREWAASIGQHWR